MNHPFRSSTIAGLHRFAVALQRFSWSAYVEILVISGMGAFTVGVMLALSGREGLTAAGVVTGAVGLVAMVVGMLAVPLAGLVDWMVSLLPGLLSAVRPLRPGRMRLHLLTRAHAQRRMSTSRQRSPFRPFYFSGFSERELQGEFSERLSVRVLRSAAAVPGSSRVLELLSGLPWSDLLLFADDRTPVEVVAAGLPADDEALALVRGMLLLHPRCWEHDLTVSASSRLSELCRMVAAPASGSLEVAVSLLPDWQSSAEELWEVSQRIAG